MRFRACGLSFLTLLSACTQVQPLPDQPLTLKPDQGLAAVVVDAPGPVSRVEYAARSAGAKDFELPDSQAAGPILYLVPVTAGRYCLQRLVFMNVNFIPGQDLGCLTVLSGHISYGGDIAPDDAVGSSSVSRQFKPEAFRTALQQRYPTLAAAYPVAAAVGPPAGVAATPDTQELSTWIQDAPDQHSQSIYVQNNTSWSLKLVQIRLYLCSNVRQTCGLHPLQLTLAPFETRQVLQVGPADPTAEYSYRYDFNYDRVE